MGAAQLAVPLTRETPNVSASWATWTEAPRSSMDMISMRRSSEESGFMEMLLSPGPAMAMAALAHRQL